MLEMLRAGGGGGGVDVLHTGLHRCTRSHITPTWLASSSSQRPLPFPDIIFFQRHITSPLVTLPAPKNQVHSFTRAPKFTYLTYLPTYILNPSPSRIPYPTPASLHLNLTSLNLRKNHQEQKPTSIPLPNNPPPPLKIPPQRLE